MTIYGRMLVAGAGSLALLLAAFGFQYLGGLAPCPLCIWQRWPHVAAVVIAGLGMTLLWRWSRPLLWVGGASMAASAGLGAWHAGIERDLWAGPSACSAPDRGDLSASELLDRIMATPMVRCDEIPWEMFGISMAGWNALASLALAAVWIWPLPRSR